MKKNKKPTTGHRSGSARVHHAHKRHHSKAYRRRHVGLLLISVLVCLSSVLQLGVIIGRASIKPSHVGNTIAPPSNQLATVRSSLGFSFGYDRAIFDVAGKEIVKNGPSRTVRGDGLRDNKPLITVTVRPKPGAVASGNAATSLYIQVPDKIEGYTDLKENDGSQADHELAARLFPVNSNPDFEVTQISSSQDSLDGYTVKKRVFEHTPTFGTGKGVVYSVQWVGMADERPFSVHLQGLTTTADIPAEYITLLDTLNLSTNTRVLGVNTLGLFTDAKAQQLLDDKYVTDLVSPAIVKIYHVKCGTIMVEGRAFSEDGCHMSSGTGFFVSSDGHIATNGHVVVFEAEDAFIQVLLTRPELMTEFLRGFGLNDKQISQIDDRPDILASIIAEIYNLPDDTLSFKDTRQTYLVSLGDKPVVFKTPQDLKDAHKFKETSSIKKADFIGADYAAKDLYVVGSGSERGFSSSDVALLEVDIDNPPIVALVSSVVTQNEKITIIGFPSDAENELVDNSSLDVTVTNGNISSIREAAGGRYKLYQSDADASRGNSGGPAINETGQALGLLTYRFKNDAAVDAAKSYIRDIDDLKELADNHDVTLTTDSQTQAAWQKGLSLYSDNRFSKAVAEFEKVQELYPAHRLATSYIDSAETAIAAGKDVKDSPLLLMAGGIIVGLAVASVAIVLIARHRGHHQTYRLTNGLVGQALPAQTPVMPIANIANTVSPSTPSSIEGSENKPPLVQ